MNLLGIIALNPFLAWGASGAAVGAVGVGVEGASQYFNSDRQLIKSARKVQMFACYALSCVGLLQFLKFSNPVTAVLSYTPLVLNWCVYNIIRLSVKDPKERKEHLENCEQFFNVVAKIMNIAITAFMVAAIFSNPIGLGVGLGLTVIYMIPALINLYNESVAENPY